MRCQDAEVVHCSAEMPPDSQGFNAPPSCQKGLMQEYRLTSRPTLAAGCCLQPKTPSAVQVSLTARCGHAWRTYMQNTPILQCHPHLCGVDRSTCDHRGHTHDTHSRARPGNASTLAGSDPNPKSAPVVVLAARGNSKGAPPGMHAEVLGWTRRRDHVHWSPCGLRVGRAMCFALQAPGGLGSRPVSSMGRLDLGRKKKLATFQSLIFFVAQCRRL